MAPPARKSEAWLGQELQGCDFGDRRLNVRFRKLAARLAARTGSSIPWACEGWANTKAAYRFLANPRIGEAAILAGHFAATRGRVPPGAAPILVLHDTTEFLFHRRDPAAIGIRHKLGGQRGPGGQRRYYTSCGIAMHSSLALTAAGLPLGLAAIKFWTRNEFKGTNALKRAINPTRVPIEAKESVRWLDNLRLATALLAQPQRCLHIGDRESDIFELLCTAHELGTHFLVRTCVDRLCGDGSETIAQEMAEAPVRGFHRVAVPGQTGPNAEVRLELRWRRIIVCPPIGKQKRYPSLMLTVLHAKERGRPQGRDPIEWKLLTDLPIRDRREAVRALQWYAMRWKIETFHKILKSGCRVEAAKLRTAERLVNLIAVCCVLGWRVFWTTMANRVEPHAPAAVAFTHLEQRLLDHLKPTPAGTAAKPSLARYVAKLARLGGYLGRGSDPPPSNEIIWRGWSRLTDLSLGAAIGAQLAGK